MEYYMNDHISDDDMKAMDYDSDSEIIINLKDVTFITSKTIGKMILLKEHGKEVKIKNANRFITEAVKTLKLEDIIEIIS